MLSTCNHVGVNKPIKIRSREKTNHSILLEIKRFYEYFLSKKRFIREFRMFSIIFAMFVVVCLFAKLLEMVVAAIKVVVYKILLFFFLAALLYKIYY